MNLEGVHAAVAGDLEPMVETFDRVIAKTLGARRS